jgi:hypothetical protein
MLELDHENPDFWREHRDTIISEGMMTNQQNEYAPRTLSKMLDTLNADTDTSDFEKMKKIRKKYENLKTFK